MLPAALAPFNPLAFRQAACSALSPLAQAASDDAATLNAVMAAINTIKALIINFSPE